MKRLAPIAICTLVALWGCEPMDPSGDPLKPVTPTAPASSAATAAKATEPAGPQGGFDFEGEDRDDEIGDDDPSIEDLYAGLGIEKTSDGTDGADEPPAKAPPPTAVPDLPSGVAAAPVRTPWQPGVAIPGSWGVRLVSTVVDAQPPRAILGMPDGSEQVVQPGTMLPTAGVVVLAVGRDAVQVAEITPDGDRAKVSSYVLTALYPGARSEP